MSSSPPANSTNKPTIEAGVAGAGGGTLIIALVNNMPSDNPYKQWLVLCAPTVAIAISSLWLWIRVLAAQHLRARQHRAVSDRLRRTLVEALENPRTSPQHKERIRHRLEELELTLVQSDFEIISAGNTSNTLPNTGLTIQQASPDTGTTHPDDP